MNWYYQENGKQIGPLSDLEFEIRVKTGRVQPNTLVWNETLKGWQEYRLVSGIQEPIGMAKQKCSQCFREFPEEEMIRYQTSWVCASCKPIFFQKMKEGAMVLPGMMEYAGFWSRFAARFIDSVILGVVNLLVIFGFIALVGFSVFTSETAGPSPLAVLGTLMIYPITFGMQIAYEAYFTARYAATPGKMALGLKVVVPGGEPLTGGRALGRAFAALLSAMICYIGFLMAAFDQEEHKALHDIICNTRVVRK